MVFVVLPALLADVSAVYDVYFAAFKDNAITQALFPLATSEDLINPESEFRYGILPRRFSDSSYKIHIANCSSVRHILRTYCSTGKTVSHNTR
jgi:hypothetical protein